MNIDIYQTKYTFEEIAQQCKDAVLRNDLGDNTVGGVAIRGKVAQSKYEESYVSAAYSQGDCH